jgi:hypothetical protein
MSDVRGLAGRSKYSGWAEGRQEICIDFVTFILLTLRTSVLCASLLILAPGDEILVEKYEQLESGSEV